MEGLNTFTGSRKIVVCGLAAFLSATFIARPLPAQNAGQGEDSVTAATPAELIYHREKLVYPAAGRRNPFAPLTAARGPDFEDLDLVGMIVSASQNSVATVIDRTTRKSYRVRRGDRVGNARVVEIRPDEVVFRVREFGVARTETLRIGRGDKDVEGG